jgi:hypothetical protein
MDMDALRDVFMKWLGPDVPVLFAVSPEGDCCVMTGDPVSLAEAYRGSGHRLLTAGEGIEQAALRKAS